MPVGVGRRERASAVSDHDLDRRIMNWISIS
jgi:hypothetical protein